MQTTGAETFCQQELRMRHPAQFELAAAPKQPHLALRMDLGFRV